MHTCSSKSLGTLVAVLVCGTSSLGAQASGGDGTLLLRPGDAVRLEVFSSLSRSAPTLLSDVSPAAALGLSATPRGDEGQARNEFSLDAQGRVLLPIVGMVQVSGRPFQEAREEVVRAFDKEFTNAVLRVTPLMRIAVLGEVRQPGLLPVDPTMTFADVLAAAGGLTDLANRKDVRLIRADGTLLLSDARDIVSVRTPLRPGDRIVVGHRSWVSANLPFVLGAGASVVASVLTALIIR